MCIRDSLRGDKKDFAGQYFLNVIVLDSHVHFSFAERLIHVADGLLERFQIAVFFVDDLFPVPLVYEDGMDVVGSLIPAYRIHVRIKSFAD